MTPTKIKLPIEDFLPPLERLAKLHILLHLKPACRFHFRCLAYQHLLHHYHSKLSSKPQVWTHDLLAAPTTSFLQNYGERLWPSDAMRRGHLFDVHHKTQPGNFWASQCGIYGPEFRTDGSAKPIGKSKLGATMLAYFAALRNVDNYVLGGGPGAGEEAVLGRIIGECAVAPSDVRELGEADRDSSPEVPLRVSSSRSVDKNPAPSKPSAIVVLPTSISRIPSGDSEEKFCVPEKCCYRRRTMGVMVACDNEDCPIEWFHPECVNLEGKDLTAIKWTCMQCRKTPLSGLQHPASIGSTSTGEVLDQRDSNLGLVSNDQATGEKRLQMPSNVAAEHSTPLPVSVPPLDGRPRYDLLPTAARGVLVSQGQFIPSGRHREVEAAHPSRPIPVEQAAADNNFIKTMKASLSSRPVNNVQITRVLEAPSTNLQTQLSAASTTTRSVGDDGNDAMDTGTSDIPFEAPIISNSGPSVQLQNEQLHRGQMSTNPECQSSSAGVQRARENISSIERRPAHRNAASICAGGSSTPWAPISRPSTTLTGARYPIPAGASALHHPDASEVDYIPQRRQYRRPSSYNRATNPTLQSSISTAAPLSGHPSIFTQPTKEQRRQQRSQQQREDAQPFHNSPHDPSIHPSTTPARPNLTPARQQSRDMPPPPLPLPPRRFPSKPSSSRTAQTILPSISITPPPPPPAPQHIPTSSTSPPSLRRWSFAPVPLLPPREWVLPTPESTFRAGDTVDGECDAWVKAKTEYYLEMTGGMGGLPLSGGSG